MSLPSSNPFTMLPGLALTAALTMVFLALGYFSPARTNPRLAWTFGGVRGAK